MFYPQSAHTYGLVSPFRDLAGWILLWVGCLGAGLLTGCGQRASTSTIAASAAFDLSEASYVGQATCVSCHQEEATKFKGSHHDRAMQLATPETVLGDFDDAEIEHHGIVSRMFRDRERYMVHTEGPDGKMADFQIQYVFGLEPLQQYMVELPFDSETREPDELPRVQVLRLSWDTEKGGWFYLAPPDVPEKLEPSDDLHWTGIAQRWNTMCAECHSTDYRKNFQVPESHFGLLRSQSVAADSASSSTTTEDLEYSTEGRGSYHSTFVEINVSCEACHGPGSVHVELAKQWFPGWNRQKGYGLANLKATAENQIQACAPCHSRRSVIAGNFKAGDNFYDYFSNELLARDVYYPDGQVLDEDYVHGSFIQSKMYHKGIRCSDCHDPHSARLKHDGNQVCTSCHQHPAAKYDSVAHHFHKPESEGAQCVNCHMPATTYMAVDSRRDHSLRIPRPDLSLEIGTPNACTGCHLDQQNVGEEKRPGLSLYQDWMLAARQGDEEVQAEINRANQWCDDACNRWYGLTRRRDDHFGLAIAAAQRDAPDAVERLQKMLKKTDFEAPAIARASGLQELLNLDAGAAFQEAKRLIYDPHPLVRSSATSALVAAPQATQGVSLLEAALSDESRSVRTEAARNLLNFPSNLWRKEAATPLRKALDELTESLEYNNDRAGAHLALGILSEQQGRDQQAIQHYQAARAVEPGMAGPRTNLAALLERNLSNQAQSTGKVNPELAAEISRLRAEELPILKRDADLVPNVASIQHRYGLALYLDGQEAEAAKRLIAAAELEPLQAAYAQAAALILEKLERWEEAEYWAEEGVKHSGNNPEYQLLLDQIRAKRNHAQAGSESE